jgi:hypothetical protein
VLLNDANLFDELLQDANVMDVVGRCRLTALGLMLETNIR